MLDYFILIELIYIEFFNIVFDNRFVKGQYVGEGFISYVEFIQFLLMLFIIWVNGYQGKIYIVVFDDFICVLKDVKNKFFVCYWFGNCL